MGVHLIAHPPLDSHRACPLEHLDYQRPTRRRRSKESSNGSVGSNFVFWFFDHAKNQKPKFDPAELQEVAQVLSRPKLNFPGGKRSRIVLGQTSAGRPLKVVYVPDDIAGSGFVVTAYELRGNALKAYRRALRRKKK